MSKPETTTPEKQELDIVYTYHAPGNNAPRFETIRESGKQLAETILEQVPDCPERTAAWAKIEEAVMWANAGIAREAARKSRTPRKAAA